MGTIVRFLSVHHKKSRGAYFGTAVLSVGSLPDSIVYTASVENQGKSESLNMCADRW